MTEPTRIILWNIPIWVQGGLYLFSVLLLALLIYNLYRQKKGKQILLRFRDLASAGLLQPKENRKVGLPHALIFYSFAALFVGTLQVLGAHISEQLLHNSFFKGSFYLWFSLIMDLSGLMLFVCLMIFYYRWFILRPKGVLILPEHFWMLFLTAIIAFTGFLVEGLRIAAAGFPKYEILASPLGFSFAGLFAGVMNVQQMTALHQAIWMGHGLLFLLFVYVLATNKNGLRLVLGEQLEPSK